MQGYRHNDKDSKYDLDEPMIDKNFAHILNLGLINADAPYRIVELNSGNSKEINLVLVNEEQAAFINYDYSSYDYTYFSPNGFQIKAYTSTLFKYLKINEIDYFLAVYDSLGFYKNYTKHQKDSIFENTRSYFQESSESIFYNTTTNHLYFDWEMYDTETPYITACKDFAAATMGDFTPTNIKDQFDFDREFGKFEFEFKGKRYYTKVEISGDWYDGAFLELINKAMEEHHLPGKFYDLPDGGQSSGHVYLTPGQYQYLLDNKMIMFFDPSYYDK